MHKGASLCDLVCLFQGPQLFLDLFFWWCLTFYQGKPPSNHHLGDVFLNLFLSILSKSNYFAWILTKNKTPCVLFVVRLYSDQPVDGYSNGIVDRGYWIPLQDDVCEDWEFHPWSMKMDIKDCFETYIISTNAKKNLNDGFFIPFGFGISIRIFHS